MNLFTIAGIVGVSVIFIGVLFATAFVTLSRMVKENEAAVRQEQSSVNPSLTFGFELPVDADVTEQLRMARRMAAARAAAQPRGANMRIGRLGQERTKGASAELDADPLTAVKIAAYHGWDGAKAGPPAGGVPQQAEAATAQPQVAPTKKPEDLVPGEDYEYTEITDDMSADEVRQARIANARARSAAVKALKQQAQAAPAAQPDQEAPAAQPAAEPETETVEVPSHISEPDYVEITDDMSPDEVRKARIQNARARSAYMKALKDAGLDPKEVMAAKERGEPVPTPAKQEAPAAEAAAEEAAAEAAPEPAAEAPAAEDETVQIPAHISKPDYIEITDDMSPDEVRQARVQNARERSRFFKALKEAGVDPKKVADQS